jgi:hypothetical protein
MVDVRDNAEVANVIELQELSLGFAGRGGRNIEI